MASSENLEEKFNLAVHTIQNLPADGIIQPSNLTKLIFYGLYKQVTLGPCKEPRPSVFYYVGRAKWDAWDRFRSMTKEQAMVAYIDEIRKIVQTMPQTKEISDFAQLIGFSNKTVDGQSSENDSATYNDRHSHSIVHTDDAIKTRVSTDNDPSLSPPLSSSSSSSSSSASFTDIDDVYDDPSDLLLPPHNEIISNNNIQPPSINTPQRHHSPHVFSDQSGATMLIEHLTSTENNQSNASPTYRRHNPSNEVRHSASLVASGGNNDVYSNRNYDKQTQRAILTALAKLQRDIHNILERLNRLETSTYLLQQRQLPTVSPIDSSSRWFPLSGFRRSAIAFILLWPFVAFILIRLCLRAKIIIRFRRHHL